MMDFIQTFNIYGYCFAPVVGVSYMSGIKICVLYILFLSEGFKLVMVGMFDTGLVDEILVTE